jgi:ATP-binding cassette subfamily F protein 3
MNEVDVRSALAAFRFYYEDTEKTVGVLSGGERARLTLCKLMLSKINLLVLDEPTNHLDIPSREALEEAVLNFDGTVIAVSHDRYFTDRLATRVIEIIPAERGGGCLDYKALHDGKGYSEYMEFKEGRIAQVESRAEAPKMSAGKEQYLKNKQDAAAARKEQARVRRLKEEAERLEARIGEIDAELYGDAATDYKKAAELEEEKSAAEERLLEIYEDVGL